MENTVVEKQEQVFEVLLHERDGKVVDSMVVRAFDEVGARDAAMKGSLYSRDASFCSIKWSHLWEPPADQSKGRS